MSRLDRSIRRVVMLITFVAPAVARAQSNPWSPSASPPAPPAPPTQSGTFSTLAVPVAFDPRAYLVPRSGTVPIALVGDGNEVAVSVPATSFGPLLNATSYSYVCTTPCTLFLAPGGASLHLGLPSQLQQDISFVVNANDPRRLTVATLSVGRVFGMIAGYGIGGFLLLGGVAALGLSAATARSTGPDPTLLGIGIGLSGVGGGLLTLAIVLTATAHAGIVTNERVGRIARAMNWTGAAIGPPAAGSGFVLATGWRF